MALSPLLRLSVLATVCLLIGLDLLTLSEATSNRGDSGGKSRSQDGGCQSSKSRSSGSGGGTVKVSGKNEYKSSGGSTSQISSRNEYKSSSKTEYKSSGGSASKINKEYKSGKDSSKSQGGTTVTKVKIENNGGGNRKHEGNKGRDWNKGSTEVIKESKNYQDRDKKGSGGSRDRKRDENNHNQQKRPREKPEIIYKPGPVEKTPKEIIIIKEKTKQNPIVIIEEKQKQEQPIIVIREEKQKQQQPIIVIREEKQKQEQPIIVIREEKQKQEQPTIAIREPQTGSNKVQIDLNINTNNKESKIDLSKDRKSQGGSDSKESKSKVLIDSGVTGSHIDITSMNLEKKLDENVNKPGQGKPGNIDIKVDKKINIDTKLDLSFGKKDSSTGGGITFIINEAPKPEKEVVYINRGNRREVVHWPEEKTETRHFKYNSVRGDTHNSRGSGSYHYYTDHDNDYPDDHGEDIDYEPGHVSGEQQFYHYDYHDGWWDED